MVASYEKTLSYEKLIRRSRYAREGGPAAGQPCLDRSGPLPGHHGETPTYHVRVHATGRDEAAEAVHVSTENSDPLTERHLIELWPAPVQSLKTLD